MKKILLAVAAVIAIVAVFVIANSAGASYTGTFRLTDGHEWETISSFVTEGDADKFTAELAGHNKIKVTYDGDYDLFAVITLGDNTGTVADYELRLYKEWDINGETTEIVSDLNKI